MNQNYIDHADICYTPLAKILPICPTWSTPSIFEIFSAPSARQISEKSYHPAKVGGAAQTMKTLLNLYL